MAEFKDSPDDSEPDFDPNSVSDLEAFLEALTTEGITNENEYDPGSNPESSAVNPTETDGGLPVVSVDVANSIGAGLLEGGDQVLDDIARRMAERQPVIAAALSRCIDEQESPEAKKAAAEAAVLVYGLLSSQADATALYNKFKTPDDQDAAQAAHETGAPSLKAPAPSPELFAEPSTVHRVTPDSIQSDIASRRLDLPPEFMEDLESYIATGKTDFFVAEAPDGKMRTQLAVDWPQQGTHGEQADNLARIVFMEIAEKYRGVHVAEELIACVLSEAKSRGCEGLLATVDASDGEAVSHLIHDGFTYTNRVEILDKPIRGQDGTFVGSKPVVGKMLYLSLDQIPF